MARNIPTEEETKQYLIENRNWGRWGDDDQRGVLNLVTAEKVVEATQLVKNGRRVSLSRFLPKTPAPDNPVPAQHWMYTLNRGGGRGSSGDFYGLRYHGQSTTHLDSICHIWTDDRLYNNRQPKDEITFDGSNWCSVDNFHEGIITRGVLIDIPRYRGEPFAAIDKPVHGWDLEAAAKSQGVSVQPGDALILYSGREAYNSANPDAPWGSKTEKPGIHPSCVPYVRENDACMVVWDMMDCSGYDWNLHSAIAAFGIVLLDNALLEPLAEACAEEGRYEFMLMVLPLRMKGGTGSPVNPVAVL